MSENQFQMLETVTFQKIRCYKCALLFYVTTQFYARRIEDGENFWCPIGHEQHFSESVKVQLEKAQSDLSQAKSQLYLERDQRIAAENARDRIKKRVSKGVCPCCKRTVSQLARHMEAKHPRYSPA